ncbi:helix-turn-helix domain-containing protein [Streptomyces sp. WAC 05379]|uniref:helix-turn-helix domain-containing protein n=1 Tax=Streptomyces sp. WAC 05379 TaxID=2203207 RepID=UPI000F7482A9|nr:helix-turn-helix domain-containing protein [Streptomyces sp. WAC 05379]
MTDTTERELIEFTDTRPGMEYRRGTFFIVPDNMVEDKNLSDAEYRVLSYLHRRAGNPNPEEYSAKNRQWCRIAFTKFETIAEETNRSLRSAKETVESLELKGYLKTSKRKTTNGQNNLYQIQFPSSYQALDKVNRFTLQVATGKKAVKKESAESRTTPSAKSRTPLSAESRTINKASESKTIETGTSTFLTERSDGVTECLPEDNQEQPLAETIRVPSGELDKEVRVSSDESLVDVVDAFASPTPVPGEAMGSDLFRTRYLKKVEQRSKAIADKNKVRRVQTRYESPLAMERQAIHEELRREFQ